MNFLKPENIEFFQKDDILYFKIFHSNLYQIKLPTFEQLKHQIEKLDYWKPFRADRKIARPILLDENNKPILDINGYPMIVKENPYLHDAHILPLIYPFLKLFCKHCNDEGVLLLPTYEEFCNEYIELTCDRVDNKLRFKPNFSDIENIVFSVEELKYRIGYAYPSFIRELYIRTFFNDHKEYFINKYSLTDFHIGYNFYEDLGSAGIDIDIIVNGQKYGICVHNDGRGLRFKTIKDTERRYVDEENQVNFGSQTIKRYDYITEKGISENTEKIGDIYLPKADNMKKFLEKVLEDILNNNG